MSPANPSLHRLTLEIERKFLPNPASIAALRKNAGRPPFRSIIPQKLLQFEDVYYDHNSVLSDLGIYIRRRDDEWEAKVRKGGDFTNSCFEELCGLKDVNQVIMNHVQGAKVSNEKVSGLEEIARFKTSRESWRVNDRFDVVIDKADFGHVVGEVELTHSLGTLAQSLDEEIEEFMRVHEWAFPTEKVAGKLSAYFARKHAGKSGDVANSVKV